MAQQVDRAGTDGQVIPFLKMGDLWLNKYCSPGESWQNYPKAPITVGFCPESFLVQNFQQVDPNLLYSDYQYISGINPHMVRHLRSVVKSCLPFVELEKDDVVLDIASNDGTLLKQYRELGISCITVGYDPATNLAGTAEQNCDHHFPTLFEGYHFNNSFKKAKIITACAVVYHHPAPVQFLREVASCLAPEGVFFCEFSYLPSILKNNAIDSIGHEHLTHLSLKSFEFMLEQAGLEIFRVELGDINSGTIRCWIGHFVAHLPTSYDVCWIQALRYYEEQIGIPYEDLYYTWADEMDIKKQEMKQLLQSWEGNIFAFGASTKGSILLQWLGLPIGRIECAIDVNPYKIGKEMVGLGIPIESEDFLVMHPPSALLVLPWCFRDQFIEKQRLYLQQGGKMIFPFPHLEIVDKNSL